MNNLTTIIIDHLTKKQDVLEKDIYIYGLEVLLLNLVNIVSIIFLGCISNTVFDAIIFLSSFIVVRQLTGGFHFKRYRTCILSFMLLYVLFLILKPIVIWDSSTCFMIFLLDMIYILFASPVENENKPLEKKIVSKIKEKKIFISFLFTFIYILFYRSLSAMFYAITLDVFLIVIEKIKKGDILQ